MSQDFLRNSVHYSYPERRLSGSLRLGLLALSVGLVSGCASNGGSGAPPVASLKTIDQSPIAVKTASHDIATTSDTPIADADKESDMTVLVLDNPELIAKAAEIGANNAQVNNRDDGPRKPHRLKFHYDFNKHQLGEEDHAILLRHAQYLKAHPDAKVQINGHTDNHGADEYNEFLSRLRAKTAARVLQEAGVAENQIDIRSWGSQKPLTNPQDHAANRRLELNYRSEQMARAQ